VHNAFLWSTHCIPAIQDNSVCFRVSLLPPLFFDQHFLGRRPQFRPPRKQGFFPIPAAGGTLASIHPFFLLPSHFFPGAPKKNFGAPFPAVSVPPLRFTCVFNPSFWEGRNPTHCLRRGQPKHTAKCLALPPFSTAQLVKHIFFWRPTKKGLWGKPFPFSQTVHPFSP